MDRPSHAGLRHVALNVRDLEEMKRFYVELLGFEVEWEPDGDNVYLSSGIDNLALHRARGGSEDHAPDAADRRAGNAHPTGSLDHLGLIVRAAEDVDRWAAFLESHGVTLDARPRTHRDGARSCYFQDPDGNKVQVIHHPPISQKA
jgi:catechol 2,3-dioxygenase-like lactoylglutathione lyase family enzyme